MDEGDIASLYVSISLTRIWFAVTSDPDPEALRGPISSIRGVVL